MIIEDFFRLYPITRKGIAQMLGFSPKFLYNVTQRHNSLSDEQISLLNQAIQELSYQLSITFVINNLTYEAKCLRCKKKFMVKDSGARSEYYNENRLVCDRCMAKDL